MESNQTTDNASASVASSSIPTLAQDSSMMDAGIEKKKSGKGMIYGMILLAIIAAGGIGFGVWAMMDGNSQMAKKDEQIDVLRKQNDELQEKLDGDVNIDVDTDAMMNEISNDGETVDAWSGYSKQLANQDIYASIDYYSYDNKPKTASAIKSKDGHLVISDYGSDAYGGDGKTLLELDDVLAVYSIRIGNGGVPYFYIVNRNGEVSRFNVSEGSDKELERVGDYAKIANIFTVGSLEAILVDIDGNIYKSY